MRMGFMVEELERFRLSDRFEAKLRDGLDQLMRSTTGAGDPDEEIPRATEWMEVAVATFRDHCIEPLLGGLALPPEELRENFSDIWRLMSRGIPPAEKIVVTREDLPADRPEDLTAWSVEYDWRLILNVARLGLLDSTLAQEDGEQLTRDKAARLAMGAIEMAEFHRRARVLRKQYSRVGPLDGS
jgi:hypothetical protein